MIAEWLQRMKSARVVDVAPELGLASHEAASAWDLTPCPVCEAERRHTKRKGEKRGPLSVPKSTPEGWRCHQCDARGDTLHLISLVLEKHRFDELSFDEKARVKAWCERFLGLDGSRRAYTPPPAPTASYPAADELAELWARSIRVADDLEVGAWLCGRGIDPVDVDARELARALPVGADVPAWAGFAKRERPDDHENACTCPACFRSWASAGFRLIVPLYDAKGVMRNVVARRITDGDGAKGVSATGHSRGGLLFADRAGRHVLEHRKAPDALEDPLVVVAAEGESDFLCWATEPGAGLSYATLGILSGSWTPSSPAPAARLPDGTTLVIATDHDRPDAKGKRQGDTYAEEIRATLDKRWRSGAIRIQRWQPPLEREECDAGDCRLEGVPLTPKGTLVEPPRDNVVPLNSRRKSKPEPAVDDGPEDLLDGFEGGALLAGVAAFAKAPIPATLRVPAGYRVLSDGSLFRIGKKGALDLVATRIPLVRRMLTDAQTKEERLEVVFLRRHVWRSAIIDRAIISVGGRDTARALGAVGAPVEPDNAKEVAQWLATLEATNELNLDAAQVTVRSGWHELDDGDQVFVLGNDALERGDLISQRMVFDDRATGGITRYVRQGGEETDQRRTLSKLIAHSDPASVMIAASLAAPLLERVGSPSFCVHAVGPSTRGKTTTLTAAGGVYGCPEIRGGQSWISTWDATTSGLEERAQGASDLPLCLDEAGLCSPDVREAAVYKLVAGQGRTRAGRAGGLRTSTSWRTVVLSTGEEELVRSTARAGAQVRILQVRVDGLGDLTGTDIAEIGADARRHYGHLGRQWIARLLEVEDWEPLRLRVRALEREFRALLGASSSIEQRQAEVYAALALAAELAEEWLDLPGLADPILRVATSSEHRVEIVPEWKRGLIRIAELIASEPGAFPYLDVGDLSSKRSRSVNGRAAAKFLGYIDEKPDIRNHTPAPESAIYLVPGPLRERLQEAGLSLDVCAREWKRLGVLIPWPSKDKTGPRERLQRRVTIDGTRNPFVTLDRGALEALLGWGDDEDAAVRTPVTRTGPAQQELSRWNDEFQDP